jgi:tetratricopeptide (TPR) repeat protein
MTEGNIYHSIKVCQAEAHLLKSEYADARSIHLQVMQKTQDVYFQGVILMNIGQIDAEIGRKKDEVHHDIEKAKALFCRLRQPEAMHICEMILGELHLAQGELQTAKTILKQCLQQSWLRDAGVTGYCLERMADTSRWCSTEFHWSSMHAVIYLAFSFKSQNKFSLHKALYCWGDIFLVNGDEVTAENLCTVALEGFTYMDVHRSRGDCMLRLGDLAKKHGEAIKAGSFWKQARQLFERSLQAESIAQIDTRLANWGQ